MSASMSSSSSSVELELSIGLYDLLGALVCMARACMIMAHCAAASGSHHTSAPLTQMEADALRKKTMDVFE